MSWQRVATHGWREPLELAGEHAARAEMALLYSGRREKHSGGTSFLFLQPATQIAGALWRELPPGRQDELPEWVGYLGYGMRLGVESYARSAPSFIDLPDFWLTSYQRIFRFNHEAGTIEEFMRDGAPSLPSMTPTDKRPPAIARLTSNFSRQTYERSVEATLERIRAGDFYQANITRKFFGEFTEAPDSFSIFRTLCEASPAPYSAYIRHGDVAILSSSPECFLTLEGNGSITSRPIKGSAPRAANAAEDDKLRDALIASEKNAAENLMIVDLMRNDFARVSEPGSVTVAEQSALYSYATIHHLVSTVSAKKRGGISAYELAHACFPPGSMTGAPKIAAVKWCEAQESMERGVYSGAIGWFAKDRCDLSVVIRTLIIDGPRFEFQVGGGIVADSEPADEWRETLVKARGIGKALGICEEELAAL